MSKTKTQIVASAPKRRRADAERSIASIIDGALEALASDPDVSMAEIARRAGVVRATIYMHFPTRESLLDAVMEHATDLVAQAIREAEPDRGEPKEALERVLLATLVHFDSSVAARGLWYVRPRGVLHGPIVRKYSHMSRIVAD